MPLTELCNSILEKPDLTPRDVKYLEFEEPLVALERQIENLILLQTIQSVDYRDEIARLRIEYIRQTEALYDQLTGWQTVQVARHRDRPHLSDYLQLMVSDFMELHGDRYYGDDRALIGGFGRIGREKCMILGHNKGRDVKENIACNFGSPHPEGYRKAYRLMKLAEKFHVPVVCLIDTPGAHAGIGAEERGQPVAIARNMMEMSRLQVPVLCIIIGEGGSGGAIGIGVGDRVALLQFSYYSVVSPEGCSSILWKDRSQAAQAADALKLSSSDLKRLGVIDDIIPEPLGGAHRFPQEAAYNLSTYITKSLQELKQYRTDDLVANRYQKFRRIGVLDRNLCPD